MSMYSIKEALNKMLEQSGWKEKFLIEKLKLDWEFLMGKTVAKYTDTLEIQNRILYINTSAGPLKNELSYNKQLLIEKINTHLESTLIVDVVVS